MPVLRRSKQTTSPIPKLPFFALRFAQCVASVLVLGVLGYFQHHLWRADYPTPWEFALLDTASAITLLNAVATTLLLCCFSLSPIAILIIDTFLSLFWLISFSLLLRAMGSTTTSKCDTREWGSSSGIRICHLFKSLVAFSLLSVITIAGSAIFAFFIKKKANSGVKYAPALNPINSQLANQETKYHGAKIPGTPSTMATMEPMLRRQSALSMGESQMKHISAMSLGESQMKHMSTMSGSSMGIGMVQQEGWEPVQKEAGNS
ncbi:hypothetical protein EX30DRAFT_342182 [Ascodesmis nigricans]|uniref:MARVEL domain-containing protein n=1 Tax=Ascodesmis nigricans TaxID=341454 RepID=A0A4S2MSD8_9PEZI|nr:hypothetical protein EX30DRAFT_342182 [Ascodesmis nigricans]